MVKKRRDCARTSRLTEVIKTMLLNPSVTMTHQQIADAVGCHRMTVFKVAKSLKAPLAESRKLLERYQQEIGKNLGIEERAKLLHDLARQKDHLPVSLKAVQYMDRVMGFERELRMVEQMPEQRTPMFVLPPGTKVDFGVPDVKEVKAERVKE